MKRSLLFGLCAMAALGLAASASASDKKGLYFVVNGATDFWKLAEAGVAKAQSEFANYSMSVRYPEQSTAAIQQRVLEDLVAGGATAIMVSAVDPKNQTEVLDRVASQIPLFTTDSDAPRTKRLAYIGSSNRQLGALAAQLMVQALPNGGKCIGFVGLPGADNARERIEGIKEKLNGTKVELTEVRSDEFDIGRAKRNVEDTLVAHPDISCLVGIYSYNTPRIYEVLKESSLLGKIKVVGFDDEPVTLGGVKEGTITGTVIQQPYEWGYQGMKMMVRVVEGDRSGIPADGIIIIPGKIIDQSNVDALMADTKKKLGK
ncbi:MAG: sugar-binding protein [Bradyrhizobium sp.]|nr:sugar-binding protein [Bradyrhizobium sp.]